MFFQHFRIFCSEHFGKFPLENPLQKSATCVPLPINSFGLVAFQQPVFINIIDTAPQSNKKIYRKQAIRNLDPGFSYVFLGFPWFFLRFPLANLRKIQTLGEIYTFLIILRSRSNIAQLGVFQYMVFPSYVLTFWICTPGELNRLFKAIFKQNYIVPKIDV